MKSLPAGGVAQRVAEAVGAAGAQCFACLAERIGLDEHDVRSAALPLICRAGLDLARGRCVRCGVLDEMLVQRKAA